MRSVRAALPLCLLAALAPRVGLAKGPPLAPLFVIVVADGLRADRLGCYGYAGHSSPTLDRLCASGVVFTHAYAQSSWSPASIASLLTARLPSEHGLRSGTDTLAADRKTFLGPLKTAGYTRVAYAADVDRGRGLDRDFDDFHWVPSLTTPLPAGTPPVYATPPIVVWLEQHRWQLRWDKLLVYFRYNGTEPAHVAPADYLRRFAPAPLDLARWTDLGSRLNMVVPRLDAGDLPDLATAYDASVAEFDTGMQAIAEVLRDPDVVQRLWLVLLAPFGDGLGEHGVIGHGATLYEQQIHVPLVIVPPPGHAAGRRYEGLVELVDVGPTILDLAGLPPEPDVRGRSLRPILEGTALSEREAVTELAPPEPLRRHLRAVVRPGLRKRIDRPDGTYEEYDLGSDPGETRDLARPAPTGAGGS